MVVATHNPSNLAMHDIEIKVPFGGFTVEMFTAERNEPSWVPVEASVICNKQ